MKKPIIDFPLGARIKGTFFGSIHLQNAVIVGYQKHADCILYVCLGLTEKSPRSCQSVTPYKGSKDCEFLEEEYPYYLWLNVNELAEPIHYVPEQKCGRCGMAAPHAEANDSGFICAMCETADILTS